MTRQNRNRALRNLAIGAVLLFAVWLLLGAPLPTVQMRMHREERRSLLPRSQVVWFRHSEAPHYPGVVAGIAPTAVYTYYQGLEVWNRNPDEPTLVPLPDYYIGNGVSACSLLAVDPPAGAESARLTLTLEIQYWVEDDAEEALYSEEYREEGVRDGECFFFPLTRRHQDTEDPLWHPEDIIFSSWDMNYRIHYCDGGYYTAPYTLEFFDGEGELILSCGNQT